MWVKLDDRFPEHPKIKRVGPMAMALFVSGLCYCNRELTDGFIPSNVAPTLLAYRTGLLGWLLRVWRRRYVTRLVGERLWTATVDADGVYGYKVHDYLIYQLSAAAVQQRRAAGRVSARAKASRNGRHGKSEEARKSSAKQTTSGEAATELISVTRARPGVPDVPEPGSPEVPDHPDPGSPGSPGSPEVPESRSDSSRSDHPLSLGFLSSKRSTGASRQEIDTDTKNQRGKEKTPTFRILVAITREVVNGHPIESAEWKARIKERLALQGFTHPAPEAITAAMDAVEHVTTPPLDDMSGAS